MTLECVTRTLYQTFLLTSHRFKLYPIAFSLPQVSWIRQRDLHIMTVGRYTYTTDQRYEVINSPGSKDWILKIKYAQVRDSGNYECQVSTKPVRTFVVHLNIFGECVRLIFLRLFSISSFSFTCYFFFPQTMVYFL